jgi:hypothetical protein
MFCIFGMGFDNSFGCMIGIGLDIRALETAVPFLDIVK